MEEYKEPENSQEEFEEEEYELGHTDKLVGLFTEPGLTFSKIASFRPKATDWLIPVFLFILASSAAYIVMMSNPQIKQQIFEKQYESLQKQVEEGNMTPEMAEQQEERIREFTDGPLGAVFPIVGIVFGTFIFFFLISGVFFVVSKFILKGEGSYSSVMVAYGLPHYIALIQVIVTLVVAFLMGKFLEGLSAASLLGMDTTTFIGMLASKLDVFSIWFYTIFGIGLAKMFKSDNTAKYVITVFGMWIGFSIIWFFISKAVPFLN